MAGSALTDPDLAKRLLPAPIKIGNDIEQDEQGLGMSVVKTMYENACESYGVHAFDVSSVLHDHGFAEVDASIPSWVNPLRFDRFLESAIGALDAAESFLNELRNSHLADLHARWLSRALHDDPDAQRVAAALVGPEYREHLHRRLAHRLADLRLYVRACELGAARLFGASVDPVEATSLHELRDRLRGLAAIHREWVAVESQRVTVISLRKTVPEVWHKDWKSGLKTREFTTRLHGFPLQARIIRMGVQVIDRNSGLLHRGVGAVAHGRKWNVVAQHDRVHSKNQRGKDVYHIAGTREHGVSCDVWEVELLFKGVEQIESSVVGFGKLHHWSVPSVGFPATPGTRGEGDVSWSADDALENLPPASAWGVKVLGGSIDRLRDLKLVIEYRAPFVS